MNIRAKDKNFKVLPFDFSKYLLLYFILAGFHHLTFLYFIPICSTSLIMLVSSIL